MNMDRNEIANDYFDWMYNVVCGGRFADDISYRRLLSYLNNTDFIYLIPMDRNREKDGIDLRSRYAYDKDLGYVPFSLNGPCSVLEMMIALAIRCEETIMDNPNIGNRTGQWFWEMIRCLGLGGMTDERFDEDKAAFIVDRFLKREYEPDGHGGLFIIRNCERDLRNVEIWIQLLWYLDTIT